MEIEDWIPQEGVLQKVSEAVQMKTEETPQAAPCEQEVLQSASEVIETLQEASEPAEKERKETQEETPQTKEECETKAQGFHRYPRSLTAFACIVNLIYVVGIAVLIGKLKGWPYTVHCFILCCSILFSLGQTFRTSKILVLKSACWVSCSTLVLVLMTTFTLLNRQVYYNRSPEIEPKWILFSLQMGIIPLLVGILVMYECSIKGLYEDRFIMMIAILDFADIWDMASVLLQDKAPFIKKESPLEIAVQFFCSLSFVIFCFLIFKNITKESLKSMFRRDDHQPAESNEDSNQGSKKSFGVQFAISTSQLIQNIPFMIIRVLIFQNHGHVDFDYLAKNVISVILWLLDCLQACKTQSINWRGILRV